MPMVSLTSSFHRLSLPRPVTQQWVTGVKRLPGHNGVRMGHWCQRPCIPSGEPGSSDGAGGGGVLDRLPWMMAVKVDGRARQNAKELSSNLHILSAVADDA